MRTRRIAAVAATGLIAAAGTGAAVAATRSDERRDREQAVLEDAAKRLGTDAAKLRSALGAAQDARLDAEVKAGRLTQAQADAIKQRRREAGIVLGGGRGGHGPGFGHHRGGGQGRGVVADAVAEALGLTRAELRERLRDGQSLPDIAKAESTAFADVEAAARTALKAELDAAVKAGRLTQERADRILDRVVERLEDFGRFRPRGFGHRP